MRNYISPFIKLILSEMNGCCQGSFTDGGGGGGGGGTAFLIDCDLDFISCDTNSILGSTCVGDPINLLIIEFLLEGSTSTTPPVCSVTYDNNTYSGCEFVLQQVCSDGVYWQMRCSPVPCSGTTPVILDCEGAAQEEPCEDVTVLDG